MQQIDKSILFFLNGLHNQFFDVFFWYATDATVYLPLYLMGIWLAYKQFGKKIWILLLFVILTVLLTDQSCNILKHTICRLRPTYNPDTASLIHVVNNYRGGDYGFPSAHACNTFGIAIFLYRIIRPKRWGATAVFFTWATLMSYSRIYLGVHYLSDILCGATVGMFIGLGMSVIFHRVIVKKESGRPPFSKKKHV